MNIVEAIVQRRSTRDFLPDPVPSALLSRILQDAARAPSGSNLQPWQVHVLQGDARDGLIEAVRAARREAPRGFDPDHPIHPETLSPLEEIRYKRAAERMYRAAGVDRDDVAARMNHLARNWEFFGAPVGLIFTIEKRMRPGQWAGVGMYMQNLMLLAEEHGLASCAQEAWALWGDLLRGRLGLDAEHCVYSGLALGYARHDAPINQFRSERAALEEFVTFHGS